MIDLQLMEKHSSLDFGDVKSKCERLFAYRREHTWPPVLTKGESWERVYHEARETLRDTTSVLSTVDEAIAWGNALIDKIVKG